MTVADGSDGSGWADGPAVVLSKEHYEVIIGHCFDGLPDEACGLLAGPMNGVEPTGEVRAVYPCRNADQSARTQPVATAGAGQQADADRQESARTALPRTASPLAGIGLLGLLSLAGGLALRNRR